MWIKGVDIPKELIRAQEEGKLVIFAGAGVSRGSPSALPDFEGLVHEVIERTGNILRREKGEPADRFLGRLEKAGPKVHEIVQKILSPPGCKPNKLHYGLLSLFRRPEMVRLVTTNFDTHFSTASTELFGRKVPIYRAPALPVGERFHGIVYLHGCVDQGHDELVVTDSDFGRAYLTEGWAKNFLKGVFAKYVVLFVGYSHNDLIMEYLARGLPPGSPRFALIPAKPEKQVGGIIQYSYPQSKWRHRGIIPIPYPHAKGDTNHEALIEAVNAWAERARMDLLDHEQQIRRIVVGSKPPLDPETASYLEEALRDPATAGVFTRYADTPEWLHWAEEGGFLKPLFDRKDMGDDLISPILARWFTDKFVLQYPEHALAVVERQGQVMNPVLWQYIAWALAFGKQPDAATLATWVAVLLSSSPSVAEQRRLLEHILERCRYPEDREVALLLFKELTAPRLVLKPSFAVFGEQGSRKVYFDVTIEGEHYWLERPWATLFKPNLGALAYDLEPIVVASLREAHILLRSVGAANDKLDPVSFRRPAIEPHAQEMVRSGLDVLIDAARDLVEWLVRDNPMRAQVVIEDWASSGIPLLKRLAVYGVTVNPHLSSDEKLDWVLAKGWLFTYGLKHEVFQLIKAAYPEAGERQRLYLLEAIEQYAQRSEESDYGTRIYEVYNLLHWLTRVAPDCELAARKFSEIQDACPQFEPRARPDLDVWTETSVGLGTPVTAEQLLATTAAQVIELWLERVEGDRTGVDLDDLVPDLWQAAAKSFDWSFSLALELVARARWDPNIWEAIIGGWAQSGLNVGQWEKLLKFLKDNPKVLRFSQPLADLLVEAVRKWDNDLRPLLPRLEALADQVWEAAERVGQSTTANGDWLLCALQHPGGKLAEFWVYALYRNLSGEGKERVGLPDAYRERFNRIISGTSAAAAMGRVMLANQLSFLFGVDPYWTRASVIGMMDWTVDRKRAEQMWHGYLHGRWSEPLLPELLPLYEQACHELQEGLAEVWRSLHEHLATIALYGTADPLQGGWLNRCLLALGESGRVGWEQAVWRGLAFLPEEGAALAWNKWMERYWENRIKGIPAPLDSKEMEAMVNWSIHLAAVFPRVVDMIVSSPVPRLEGGRFYLDLADSGLAARYPRDTARLMIHLLSGVPCMFPHCPEVQEIYQQVKTAGLAAAERLQLREQLLRVGCWVEEG